MENQIVKRDIQLPSTIEDLSRFVLVGREKLTSVRAEIRVIDKLQLAEDVRQQKKEEATFLAEALLDAETRIGELIPPPTSQRNEAGRLQGIRTLPEGISWNQSSAFQKMAAHKDIIELVKTESRERDELPTRTAVLDAIRFVENHRAVDPIEYDDDGDPIEDIHTCADCKHAIVMQDDFVVCPYCYGMAWPVEMSLERPICDEWIVIDDDEEEEISKPHVAHNSGNNEWYTPAEYIEAARKVLGVIDLDPASSILANTVVKAEQIYTVEDDGLAKEWIGNVWLNPPYAGDLIHCFVEKLSNEVFNGNVESCIVLVNNATETKWFLKLVKVSSAICFPIGRVKYWGTDGTVGAPLQGQAIVYIGNNIQTFLSEFEQFGWIVIL